MTAMGVFCTDCGSAYPIEGVPYLCPICSGLYDYSRPFQFDPEHVDQSQPGIWRYRHSFSLPSELEPVSLGEGNTPLVWATAFSHQIAFKCEFINPSGSFKDRGSTVISTWLKARGVTEAVEDSSGNAGASFAAYAVRGGIKARIFMPESSSGPKRKQIEAYGAEINLISGLRSSAADAARTVAKAGVAYASHAYLPFNLPGYATIAYEIFEQLGQIPGTVVVPAGQGGLLLGLARGFDAMRVANIGSKLPMMIGVQASACAPLWALFTRQDKASSLVMENPTLAEGVRVCDPLRKDPVLKAVTISRGMIYIVEENKILPGRDALARLGFYVEPTSAIIWSALADMADEMPEPIVAILTGSGMKYG